MTTKLNPQTEASFKKLSEDKIRIAMTGLRGQSVASYGGHNSLADDWYEVQIICSLIADKVFTPMERIAYIREMAGRLNMDAASGIFLFNDTMRVKGYSTRVIGS